MNTEMTSWLVQEVHDLLDVSSVGLYEFLDILRSPDLQLSGGSQKRVARQALELLMQEPGVQLKRLRWPEWESLGSVNIDELPPDPWAPPDHDGYYFAIDRVD